VALFIALYIAPLSLSLSLSLSLPLSLYRVATKDTDEADVTIIQEFQSPRAFSATNPKVILAARAHD
jgi:hypothetical protein